MSRLSREKKRDQNRAAGAAAFVTAPIDVRVPAAGAVGAWVGGVPVAAAAGEEIQQAVLNHLQRIALATGNPVHAAVHDERIGYVVHLRVETDGASSFTGEPVGMTAPAGEPRDVAKGLPALPPVPSPPPALSPPRSLPPSPPSAPALPPAPPASVPALSPAPSPAVPEGSPAVPEGSPAEPVASSTEPPAAPAAVEPGQP